MKIGGFWTSVVCFILGALVCIYDLITIPVYFILQKPWRRKLMENVARATVIQKDESNIVYRSLNLPKEFHSFMVREGITTMAKLMHVASVKYAGRRCLGTREILAHEDEKQPSGRIFKKLVLGEYKWRTYEEVEREAACFGRGLRFLGLQPSQNIVIFAETRAEWLIAAHGCFKHNIHPVTLYATLGEDAIAHGINEAEVTAIISTSELCYKFKGVLTKTPKVKLIICIEDQLQDPDQSGLREDVQFLLYSQVVQQGSLSTIDEVVPIEQDIAIIMYTSGSTGVPKGVIITHKNMISTLKSFSDSAELSENDIYVGYLPLAHIFELLSENVCLLHGMSIGYSAPLTLTDKSSKIKAGEKGDTSVLKPTIMLSVPLILERISKAIEEKVREDANLFQKGIIKFALSYRHRWLKLGFDTPLLNRIIFQRMRNILGGRLKYIMCGGAPLNSETQESITIFLCVKVLVGYGLTETCSLATVTDIFDMSNGRVGGPASLSDIRLVNWEEGDYTVSDKPVPRGEIHVGGDSVSPGYYKLPGETETHFYEADGRRWMRTGDVGEMHSDGILKIIDRKKDILKLQQGEYISPVKVETVMKSSPLVDNIFVHGESTQAYAVALIVPNEKQLRDRAAKLGLKDMTFEELCGDARMEKLVLKELQLHGVTNKLLRFEIPANIKLCSEIWTPDTGLVTDGYKLKRKEILKRYKKYIESMYE